MKIKSFLLLNVCTSALLVGCASTPKVQRVDATAPGAVTTMGVDIADFKDSAGKMVESLLASGSLDSVQGRKAIVGVSTIRNDTPDRFDTDQIMFKITTDLNKSQKAVTTTTWGKNTAIDKNAQSIVSKNEFLEDKKVTGSTPDFTIAGKILYSSARDGRTRSASYTLQLYLTDTRSGLAVWQEEDIVSKQSKKSAVSF